MKAQQQRWWPQTLALQVSPCLTLGLLLAASLSARAAGLPCDLSACLQRVASQAQQSATVLSGTDGHERLQLFGAPHAAATTTPPGLLPLTTALTSTPSALLISNGRFYAAAHPRAP